MNTTLLEMARKAADQWRKTDAYHQAAVIIDMLIEEIEHPKMMPEDYSKIHFGTEVWYVDFNESFVEHGVIKTVSFKDGEVDCFGVEWDDGDFDVYNGSGLGTYYFLDKKNADKRLIAGDVK